MFPDLHVRYRRRGCFQPARLSAALILATIVILFNPAVLLAKTTPTPFPGELVVQHGHTSTIRGLDYASDGSFIASGGKDSSVRLWAPNGRLIRDIQMGFWVTTLKIMPDNQTILVGGQFGQVKLVSTMGKILKSYAGSKLYVNAVAVSPDGRTIAASSSGGLVNLYDVQGKHKGRFVNSPKTGPAHALLFSPDGRQLITGGWDKTIRFWSLAGKLIRSVTAHDYSVYTLALSPDGKLLASGGSFYYAGGEKKKGNREKLVLRLWKPDGTPVRSFKAHGSGSLRFTPDGKHLVSGGRFDNRVHVFDLHGKRLRTFKVGYNQHTSPALIVLSPDGKEIITADRNHSPPGLQQWTFAGSFVRGFKRLDASVKSIAFHPSGKYFATGAFDKKIRFWQVTGRLLKTISGHKDHVERVAWSPNGRLLASVGSELFVWDAKGKKIASVKAHKNGAEDLVFSKSGKLLVSCGGDGNVNILDLTTGKLSRFKAGKGRIWAVAIDPAEKRIATAMHTEIKLWDLKGKLVADCSPPRGDKIKGLTSPVFAMQFSADGRSLIINNTDRGRQLKVIDFKGKIVQSIETFNRNQWGDLRLSPSGRWLAATTGRRIAVWDAKTFKLYRVFEGHTGPVNSLSFNRDETLLLSSSRDSTTRLWNLGNKSSAALISDGDRWVMYTPDGYFDTSKYGGDLLAMINGMKAYGIDQFALKYNRPDIILQRMGIGSKPLIVHYRELYKKRLRKTAFSEERLSGILHTPTVKIEKGSQDGKRFHLTATLRDEITPLKAVQVYVNDVPLFDAGGKPVKGKTVRLKETLELSGGENKIEVSAVNRDGAESERALTFARYEKPAKRDLYFIGFGVSQYANSAYNLKFAHKDVLDMAQLMQRYQGGYDRVHLKTFTDAEATRKNLLGVKSLLQQAGVDDTVVLMVTGHGMYDQSSTATYYFIPHKVDVRNLARTAVSFEELEAVLQGTAARKKLLLMDTCESGEIDVEQQQRLYAQAKGQKIQPRTNAKLGRARLADTLRRVFLYDQDRFIYNDLRRRSGTIVFSSSKGGEFSFESTKLQNGFFTAALLDALSTAKADRDKNRQVSIKELLDYVSAKVSLSTGGLQNPTIDRENIYQQLNFPVIVR